MKAIIQTGYGVPTRVLELGDVEKPCPKDDEVLIRGDEYDGGVVFLEVGVT